MFKPSHYLVCVQDLPHAVADFEQAGFCVTWGSAPETAHNALIHFESGGFVELYVSRRTEEQKQFARQQAEDGVVLFQRFLRTGVDPKGFCEFALETEWPMADALAELGDRIALTGLWPGSRERPDGVTTHWEMSFPEASVDLPFLMGPYDPPPVITEKETAHANGMRAIDGLRMTHPEPAVFAAELLVLMPAGRSVNTSSGVSLHVADFEIRIDSGAAVERLALLSRTAPAAFNLHGLRIENTR